MIGLVTSVVVLMPMVAPLIGGILDTLFGWEAIFLFTATLTVLVLAWAFMALPETNRSLAATAAGVRLGREAAALATSGRFLSYALCAALGSAPFFSFIGGAPHVVVTMLGRTSAEYGMWFFAPAIGFMTGNFAVSRLAARYGIDALIRCGIGVTIAGCLLAVGAYLTWPGREMATIFLPQLIVGFGNGLLLPTAVAGAVSIRPQVAGTASGLIGFIQMSIAAGAAQLAAFVISGAADAMPLLLLMLACGLATAVAAAMPSLMRRGGAVDPG
jgi:DHA1 family bicyclomycin/chloramphenicol resistance-like MFS transporter